MGLEYMIGADASGLFKTMDKVENSFGKVAKQAKTAGLGLMGFGAAASGGIGIAARAAANLDDEMRNINTMMGLSDNEFANMKDSVVELSKTVPQSSEALAQGLYGVISAGVPAGEAMAFLETSAKAASAGLTDTETAVSGITGIIKTFGLEFTDAELVADKLFTTVRLGQTTFEELSSSIGSVAPTAAAAGVNLDELMATYATLTGTTGNAAEVSTQLKAALSNVIKPSKEAQEMAAALGIEFNQQALESQGLQGFLETLADATGGNIETMGKLFGSTEALNAVMALTGTQSDTFAAKLDEMQNSAGAMTAAFEEQSKSMGVRWQLMKNNIMAVVTAIGDQFLPTAIKLTSWLANTITQFTEAHPNLAKFAALTLGVAAAVGIVGGPLLMLIGFIPTIVAGFTMLIGVTRTLSVTMMLLSANPIGAVIAAIGALIVISIAIYKNWDDISAFLKKTWANVSELAVKVFNAIVDFFNKWGSRILVILTKAIKLIVDMFDKKFAEAKGRVTNILTAILSFIRGLVSSFKMAGYDIMSGLKDGILDAGQEAINKARQIAESIKDKVTGFFDIHSPSRVMIDIGANVIMGSSAKTKKNAAAAVELIRQVRIAPVTVAAVQ